MTTRNNRLCTIIDRRTVRERGREGGTDRSMDGWKERQLQWPLLSLMFNFTQFQLYAES